MNTEPKMSDLTEMQNFKWTYSSTGKDKINNEYVSGPKLFIYYK